MNEDVKHLDEYNSIKQTDSERFDRLNKDIEEIIENDASYEELDFLKSPDLVFQLRKEVQKRVAGEDNAILVIGLYSCGRLVVNSDRASYNLIPNDESGVGKDYVTKQTLKVFVPNHLLHSRSRISPTVLNYWHNSEHEPEWDWNYNVLYLIDVHDSVLNSEVIKTFTSDETRVTITRNQLAVDIEIKGKPVLIVTTANGILNSEQLRRFTLFNLDSSIKQTKAIQIMQAKEAASGKKIEYDKLVLSSMNKLKPKEVIIPYAGDLIEYLPDNKIMRTATTRFFDLIKASAALHQFQREKDSKGRIIANGIDYNLARLVILETTSNSQMIPITHNQNKIIKVIKELDKSVGCEGEKWSATEIVNAIKGKLSDQKTRENLGKLAHAGVVERCRKTMTISTCEDGSEESREYKRELIAYKLNRIEELLLPKWCEIQKAKCPKNELKELKGLNAGDETVEVEVESYE